MKNAAVSALKATLSQFLAYVKKGEELLITERGKPIAKIIPLRHSPAAGLSELYELERAGVVKIGSGHLPKNFWTTRRPVDARGLARKALVMERSEGR